MDLSEEMKQMVQADKESEIKTKRMLEISAKKYHLEKDLRDANFKLSAKQSELKTLRKEVISLSSEFVVLEKQAELARQVVVELTAKVVVEEAETEATQASYWKRINDFISDANHYFRKQETLSRVAKNNGPFDESRREEKIHQLKVEGHLEAARLYEKYQSRKIEELKLIKETLAKEQL